MREDKEIEDESEEEVNVDDIDSQNEYDIIVEHFNTLCDKEGKKRLPRCQILDLLQKNSKNQK